MSIGSAVGYRDRQVWVYSYLNTKSWTRRGLLSVISSVYDPLWFTTPFLLQGQLLIQQLCKENLGWDETIPNNIQRKWARWERQLKELEGLSVDRCFTPANFGKTVDCSFHHLEDACEYAHGQASYLCIVDATGIIHCCLVIGKSGVTSLTYITMPKMELVPATLLSEDIKPSQKGTADELGLGNLLDR